MALSVEDDGAGVDPGFLPRIFEVLRQSDVGTGIGLSIAKQTAVRRDELKRAAAARPHGP